MVLKQPAKATFRTRSGTAQDWVETIVKVCMPSRHGTKQATVTSTPAGIAFVMQYAQKQHQSSNSLCSYERTIVCRKDRQCL